MEKEISDDSYCTTDEGEKESNKGYESDTEDNQDEVGLITKIEGDKITKEILSIGEGKKPIEIDNVIISSECFYDCDGNKFELPELNFKSQEFSLDDSDNFIQNYEKLPKIFKVSLQSMRKKEVSKITTKFSYIFKHFDKLKTIKSELNSILYNEEFRNKMKNEILTINLTLEDFFICQNLMDRGEIRKKILNQGISWHYPRNPDIVRYNISCSYDNKLLYDKNNCSSELDANNLYEIEKRVLQNLKIGELAEICVQPSYMRDKNSDFLKNYSLDNTKPTFFKCEILSLDIYDYVYKPDKDKLSKKRILQKGFGRDSPDRESLAKIKIQIKLNTKIIFSNFEIEDINEYILNSPSSKTYPSFRDQINEKYKISQIDDDEDYERDFSIFQELDSTYKNLINIDLRLYSIPLVVRKVLIHMKRNEVCYIKTNKLDSFSHENFELEKLEGNIEICIHLYEFLPRRMFSKLSFEEKYKELIELKEKANKCFKQGKFYRASKIYSNINYRYNWGQVFSDNPNFQNESGDYLKNTNSQLYDQLVELRLSCHNNLANCKYKLGLYESARKISNKILNNFDKHNLKAMFLLAKSLIKLKDYEKSVQLLQELNIYSPSNSEFVQTLKEAQDLLQTETHKQKSIYKKMIFSN